MSNLWEKFKEDTSDLLESTEQSVKRRAITSIQGNVYNQNWLKVAGRFITGSSEFTDDWVKELHDKWYSKEEPWKKGDLKKGRIPETRVRERMDMLLLSAGEPQQYNSIVKSKFTPTRGAEKDDVFYTFKDKKQMKKVYEGLKEHIPKMEKGKSYNVGTKYHVKHVGSDFLNPGLLGLGNYQISKGEDEKGKYLAVFDVWDIDASAGPLVDKAADWALPGFTVYDRYYYEGPKKSKPIEKPTIKISKQKSKPTKKKRKRLRDMTKIDDKVFGFLSKSAEKIIDWAQEPIERD
tara:strand:- start:219 stop:1094 length:876 start_codon:yes stop_codon:yes gene_type:complete